MKRDVRVIHVTSRWRPSSESAGEEACHPDFRRVYSHAIPTRDGKQMNTDPDGRPLIRLDQFLKLSGVVGSGGQAKVLIQQSAVKVNGVVETRRGRKLRPGDVVECEGESLTVEWNDSPDVD
jgi:ribosome-associated protein